MMAKLFDVIFGCWHSHYSFPMTTRRDAKCGQAANAGATYVVCLDCGKELPYDWKLMRVMDAPLAGRPAPILHRAKEVAA